MKPASPPTDLDVAQLIEAHQAGVWRYLRALGCESSLAEDLTQDTFVSVLQKPFQQYNRAATAAYLRRVAYNLFISAQRRSGRVSLVENIEEFDSDWLRWGADEDGGESMVDALRGCFQELTDRARLALNLRFRDRASRAEIAAQLGVTEHGAKNLMQRAKHSLRQCIESKIVE
ncbi:MAG: RNA polymerase sigma factor [Pirellulaceae bacterium]|jgi:RNA polymerase sigma-70 factor (ECF subfamily)|nr:RNA polymerase sigma factor [Pirellulaceae bacterium]MDP7018893.1 RNA polymerase sigma factor [Pirellulaceae bacterium]